MSKYFLGIDTSCYTTSLAVVDVAGNLVHDIRRLLPVAAGERGLRQSDGVFYHVRHLSEVWNEFKLPKEISAVAVSARPRPQADSYMPVFLAGLAMAGGIASAREVPLYRFSHQEGHIAAGLQSMRFQGPFLAVHISGGTTEILRVTPCSERAGFAIHLLLATSDLSAGQMIDRVGVALGLPFPAGPALEQLSSQASGRISLPSVASPTGLSFSGPCSAALRLIEQGEDPHEIAFATLRVVANSLEKGLRWATEKEGLNEVLLVGGVMSNQLIRRRLEHRLGGRMGLHFTPAQLCTDNAVGIANLARVQYLLNREGG